MSMMQQSPTAVSARLGRAATAACVGYLVGTLPSADIVTRAATGGRVNIREAGTGNPGAANVAGVLGKKWGAVVMVADVAKGAVASLLGARVGGVSGLHLAGTAAVGGHCYPVWEGFEGGKGVATSVGQVLASFPIYTPIDAAVGFVTSRISAFDRQAHVATEISSLVWVACATLWWRKGWPNPGAPKPSAGLPLGAAATSIIIAIRFRQTNQRVDAWRDEQGRSQQGSCEQGNSA